MGGRAHKKKKKKEKHTSLASSKSTVMRDCRNQGRVSLSPIRLDLDNEKSEQRRRVGNVHILHSAAPGCPRLKVARHLCHFGPGIVWAGGQGQGNICITSEGLAVCPHHGEILKNRFEKDAHSIHHSQLYGTILNPSFVLFLSNIWLWSHMLHYLQKQKCV